MKDLDTLMGYAKKRLSGTEISKLDDAMLMRLHEWILSVLKDVANKIPSLTPIIDEKIDLFWNWDIQCFFDVDFTDHNYRKWLAETNIVIFNFLIMDVQNKMGTITVKCKNKVRFGFCACAFYIALKNTQKEVEEEIEFRGLGLNPLKNENKYPPELLKIFHNDTAFLDSLQNLKRKNVARKILQRNSEKKNGVPLMENINYLSKEKLAGLLMEAGILKGNAHYNASLFS